MASIFVSFIVALVFVSTCKYVSLAPTADSEGITHYLTWSENVSNIYSPETPLRVNHGDKLHITCPPDATSNIWIQDRLEQYNQCNCNVTGVNYKMNCTEEVTRRHVSVCQDEVFYLITSNSNSLNSALSFEPATIYYLISYSRGLNPLDGYKTNFTSGGECLQGFRMVFEVLPIPGDKEPEPTTQTTAPPTKESEKEAKTTPSKPSSTTKFIVDPLKAAGISTSGALQMSRISITGLTSMTLLLVVTLLM